LDAAAQLQDMHQIGATKGIKHQNRAIMFMYYLSKYLQEITTKSRKVRKPFCHLLRKNIDKILCGKFKLTDKALPPYDLESIKVEMNWDHLLRSFPGIWHFSG
jgi:adenylyl- and sulfurtransferase ThiI